MGRKRKNAEFIPKDWIEPQARKIPRQRAPGAQAPDPGVLNQAVDPVVLHHRPPGAQAADPGVLNQAADPDPVVLHHHAPAAQAQQHLDRDRQMHQAADPVVHNQHDVGVHAQVIYLTCFFY